MQEANAVFLGEEAVDGWLILLAIDKDLFLYSSHDMHLTFGRKQRAKLAKLKFSR